MIIVALGSNLPGEYGTPRAALLTAIERLKTQNLRVVKTSRIFETAPVPVSDQPWYANAVVQIETHLSPADLLRELCAVEHAMGRVRTERNAARIIDLDIIAYNDITLNTDNLTIPHPRMHERAFVLHPIKDIAPNWIHPVTKTKISDLVAALPRDQKFRVQWFTAKPVYLMGILNVTPDSFSDGGKFFDAKAAIAHGKRLIDEGADILDIGGESTRPGALPLSPSEEQDRVLPVIEALRDAFISIDTRNAATMRAAFKSGAHMVNDVTALTHDPDAMNVAASFDGPVCLMHMQGTPETMQINPVYENVVEEIYSYLQSRIAACEAAGIDKSRLVADPGFGFGKTLEHNLSLLNNLSRFNDLGVPVLAGVSRKRFLGALMNNAPADQRLQGSLNAAKQAVSQGARILRVHDVVETKRFLNL